MLTIREPLPLRTARLIPRLSPSFGEKIEANYKMAVNPVNEEELFHLSEEMPWILIQEGCGHQTIRSYEEYQKYVTIQTMNQVLNRLMLWNEWKYTYQDQIYLERQLRGLGIREVSSFLRQVRESFREEKEIYRLKETYENLGGMIREASVNWEKLWEKPEGLDGGEQNEVSARELSREIYRRLGTERIYQEICRLWRSQAAGGPESSYSNEILRFAEYERIGLQLALSKAKEEALGLRQGLPEWMNPYERVQRTGYGAKSVEQIKSQVISAVLLNLAEQVYIHRLETPSGFRREWTDIRPIFRETAINTLERFEEFHRGNQGMTERELAFRKEMLEFRREESTILTGFEAWWKDAETGESREKAGEDRGKAEKRQEETGRSREETERSREEPRRSQTEPRRSQVETGGSQEELRRGQKETGRSQEEPRRGQKETGRSQEETGRSQEETGRSREEPRRSQEEIGRSQKESRGSQEETGRSREESRRSQEETGRSQEESRRSQEESGRSQEEPRRSQGKLRKSQEVTGRSQEETGRNQAEPRRSQEESSKIQTENIKGQEETGKSKAEIFREILVKSVEMLLKQKEKQWEEQKAARQEISAEITVDLAAGDSEPRQQESDIDGKLSSAIWRRGQNEGERENDRVLELTYLKQGADAEAARERITGSGRAVEEAGRAGDSQYADKKERAGIDRNSRSVEETVRAGTARFVEEAGISGSAGSVEETGRNGIVRSVEEAGKPGISSPEEETRRAGYGRASAETGTVETAKNTVERDLGTAGFLIEVEKTGEIYGETKSKMAASQRYAGGIERTGRFDDIGLPEKNGILSDAVSHSGIKLEEDGTNKILAVKVMQDAAEDLTAVWTKKQAAESDPEHSDNPAMAGKESLTDENRYTENPAEELGDNEFLKKLIQELNQEKHRFSESPLDLVFLKEKENNSELFPEIRKLLTDLAGDMFKEDTSEKGRLRRDLERELGEKLKKELSEELREKLKERLNGQSGGDLGEKTGVNQRGKPGGKPDKNLGGKPSKDLEGSPIGDLKENLGKGLEGVLGESHKGKSERSLERKSGGNHEGKSGGEPGKELEINQEGGQEGSRKGGHGEWPDRNLIRWPDKALDEEAMEQSACRMVSVIARLGKLSRLQEEIAECYSPPCYDFAAIEENSELPGKERDDSAGGQLWQIMHETDFLEYRKLFQPVDMNLLQDPYKRQEIFVETSDSAEKTLEKFLPPLEMELVREAGKAIDISPNEITPADSIYGGLKKYIDRTVKGASLNYWNPAEKQLMKGAQSIKTAVKAMGGQTLPMNRILQDDGIPMAVRLWVTAQKSFNGLKYPILSLDKMMLEDKPAMTSKKMFEGRIAAASPGTGFHVWPPVSGYHKEIRPLTDKISEQMVSRYLDVTENQVIKPADPRKGETELELALDHSEISGRLAASNQEGAGKSTNYKKLKEYLDRINEQNVLKYRELSEKQIWKAEPAVKKGLDMKRIRAESRKALTDPAGMKEHLKMLKLHQEEEPGEASGDKQRLEVILRQTDDVTRYIYEQIWDYNEGKRLGKEVSQVKAIEPIQLVTDIRRMTDESREGMLLTNRGIGSPAWFTSGLSGTSGMIAERFITDITDAGRPEIEKKEDLPTAPAAPIVYRQPYPAADENLLEELARKQEPYVKEKIISSVSESVVKQQKEIVKQTEIINESSARELQELIEKGITRQMGNISEKVYHKLEKKMEREIARRGRS